MSDIVNRFSQMSRFPIREVFLESNGELSLDLYVGEYHVKVFQKAGAGTTKKSLKHLACALFVQTYINPITQMFNYASQAADYLEYSRTTVLKNANIHINKIPETKPTKIAFDSEGIPPMLIQICFDEKNVYLYTDLTYPCTLLYDPTVEKLICDVQAEQRQFGPIPNATDIQGPEKKSLVKHVNEYENVHLQKDKRVHIRGWHYPFTKDQIDYAAADALWIWIVSNKNNLIDNNNNVTDSAS